MTRPLVIGNGSMTIGLDDFALIRNLCYPYVGKEDHVKGHHHRNGVWVDGVIRWVQEGQGWIGSPNYQKDSLVGDSVFTNPDLGIELTYTDCVHHAKNIYVRKIKVRNLTNQHRDVKLFLNQHFHIAGDNVGDTALYEPYNKCLIHYKAHRYFLINGRHNDELFSQFATGAADEGTKLGTWVDGNDGHLSGNPIEHGSVDSTISFDFTLAKESSEVVYFWICIAQNLDEVQQLNALVLKRSAERLIKETAKYWKDWVHNHECTFYGVDDAVIDLFKRSLLIVRTFTNENGAMIAAIDSDIMTQKQDTYNYMWPRDGALISRSLDKSGYTEITDNFFDFCADVITDEGYLFHKYLPDKSFGSSWHPWYMDGKAQLPIQEDETALVLDALWKKFKRYNNKALITRLYDGFVKKAAMFLVTYRDPETKLPKESYDLWEEKRGVHTFTCSTVYAGLMAAHHIAASLKKSKDARLFKKAADEVKAAILHHLYNPKTKRFVKRIYTGDNLKKIDDTIDISTAYGLFEYGILEVNDPRMEETMNQTIAALHNPGNTGGFLRYEHDSYFRTYDGSKGNPWFISSLWVAEYYLTKAQSFDDIKPAIEIFNWVVRHAAKSGVLAEQLDPHTGRHLSLSPLTWSHAGYIIAIIKYLDRVSELGIAETYCK